MPELEPFIGPEVVAEYLQIDPQTAVRFARLRYIPAHPLHVIGKRMTWRFLLSKVRQTMLSRPTEAAKPISGEANLPWTKYRTISSSPARATSPQRCSTSTGGACFYSRSIRPPVLGSDGGVPDSATPDHSRLSDVVCVRNLAPAELLS